jgi:hypothetical protein
LTFASVQSPCPCQTEQAANKSALGFATHCAIGEFDTVAVDVGGGCVVAWVVVTGCPPPLVAQPHESAQLSFIHRICGGMRRERGRETRKVSECDRYEVCVCVCVCVVCVWSVCLDCGGSDTPNTHTHTRQLMEYNSTTSPFCNAMRGSPYKISSCAQPLRGPPVALATNWIAEDVAALSRSRRRRRWRRWR